MKNVENNPVRVLQAVGVMNRGGAETLLMNIYRNIDRKKVQFDFLTHHPMKGAYDDEIKKLGGKIYSIPYGVKTLHYGYVSELKKFFKSHPEYKIIHSHMSDISGVMGKVAKECLVPVRIAHSHISNPQYSLFQKIYLKNYSRRLIPKYCTDFFACSYDSGMYLYNSNKNNLEFKVIKNGINIEEFSSKESERIEAKKYLNCTDKVVVGHVGRFEKQKNHELLIDIFYEFNKVVPNSELILIGASALNNEGTEPLIRKKVKEYNLEEQVKFLGSRGDVNKLIKGFDLFVFPSLYEGLPVTLIEAQGAGIQCLVSDKVTKEIDLGIGSLNFVELDNVNQWVEAMVKALSRDNPKPERCISKIKDMGYDIKFTAKELENYYISKVENLY